MRRQKIEKLSSFPHATIDIDKKTTSSQKPMLSRFLFLSQLAVAVFFFSSCKKEAEPAPTAAVLLEGNWIESSRTLRNGKWEEFGFPATVSTISYRFTSWAQGIRTETCPNRSSDWPFPVETGTPIGPFYFYGCTEPGGDPAACTPKPCQNGSQEFAWTFDAGTRVAELTLPTGGKAVWKIVEIGTDLIRANQITDKEAIAKTFLISNGIDGVELILKRKK